MFIKLGIITGILILAGLIFLPEIDYTLSVISNMTVDSLKDDVTNFGIDTSNSVEQRITKSIDTITGKANNTLTSEISEYGIKTTDEISKAVESSQKTIYERISDFNPIKYIENILPDWQS